MTFDDDMARLFMDTGPVNLPLKAIGLEWPPPERLTHINGLELPEPMTLRSCSTLTDEQRVGTTHVIRGCVYRYESDEDDRT